MVTGMSTSPRPAIRRSRIVTPEGTSSVHVQGQVGEFDPWDLDFAPDGSLYIASGTGLIDERLFRIDPDGSMVVVGGVTGQGTGFNIGSGMYAIAAQV